MSTENTFSLLMQSMPFYFFVKDISNGFRYIATNPAFDKLFDLPPGDSIGKTDEDLLGKHNNIPFIRARDQAIADANTGQNFLEEIRDAKGVLHHLHTFKVPVRSPDGQFHLIGLSAETTLEERRFAAQEQMHQLLALIVHQIPVMTFAKRADQDFRYVLTNPCFEEFIGRPANAILGHNDYELFPTEREASWFRDKDEEIMRGGKPVVFLENPLDGNGHPRHLRTTKMPIQDAEGHPLLLGVTVDLADLYQARLNAENEARRFKLTLQSIGDGVLTTDAFGKITLLNPVAERLTGWSQADAEGRPHEEILRLVQYPGDAPVASPVRTVLRTGNPVELGNHTDLIARDGSRRHIADSAAPIFDASGSLIGSILVFRDVTEEYDRRDELQRVARGLRYATDLAKAAYFHYDPITGVVNGINFENNFWPLDEHQVPISRGQWILPEDLPLFASTWDALRSGQRKHVDIQFRSNRDGPMRHFRIKASYETAPDGKNHISGVLQDVTEIARHAAQLKASSDLWNLIINTMPVMFFAKRADEDFRYLLSNRHFQQFVGHTQEEITGHTDAEIFQRPSEAKWFRDKDRAIMENGTEEFVEDSTDAQGITRRVRTTKMPFTDAEGRPLLIGVSVDITEITRAAEEREALHQQLQQSLKLESVGQLAGGIAHDFNNMLQAILGNAEIAMDALPPSSPIRREIAAIQAAAQRSADLTRSLLLFAGKQSSSPTVLDLNSSISNMRDILARLLDANIRLEWVPCPGSCPVCVDPSRLDHMVTNLCLNARDAITGQGTILLRTQTVTLVDPLLCTTGRLAPGTYSCLMIVDSGCGMDEATISRVFDPFFTTKPIGKGTGLGLPSVYGTMQEAEGAIHIISSPGNGTTFQLFFPAPETQPLENTPEAPSTSSTTATADLPRGTESILVVDDEPSILSAARRMLENLGYTVYTDSDPLQARQVLRAGNPRIDLLLTDVIMPSLNGPDLVRDALTHHPDLPHLYMSGYTANLLEEQGAGLGTGNLIFKPFTSAVLARRIRARLDTAQKSPTA